MFSLASKVPGLLFVVPGPVASVDSDETREESDGNEDRSYG